MRGPTSRSCGSRDMSTCIQHHVRTFPRDPDKVGAKVGATKSIYIVLCALFVPYHNRGSNCSMASICMIPTVVWEIIFSKFLGLDDLRNLAAVSKRIHEIVHLVNAFQREKPVYGGESRVGRVELESFYFVANAWRRVPFICCSTLGHLPDPPPMLPSNLVGLSLSMSKAHQGAIEACMHATCRYLSESGLHTIR